MPKSNPLKDILIDGRRIGPSHPPYIAAEMSGNHNGDIQRAFNILDAAKRAGADAIKLQTYRPDTITIDHDSDEFKIKGGLWDGRRLYELYEEAHTPWSWHADIFAYAAKIGITIFSSPFDQTAVELLESLKAPAYKIASPELIDIPLIRQVAKTCKPIIISTGMGTMEEISEALECARMAGAADIIVLHCTSAYPTPPDDANLATLRRIADLFNVHIGLSDHSQGTLVSSIAVAMGACFIEKHFTLSRDDGGVDSAFSLEPQELEQLVLDCNIAKACVGQPAFSPTKNEQAVLLNRRSLYIVGTINKGDCLTLENVRSIRPGNGMKPKYLDQVIGRRASRDLQFGEALNESMFEGSLDREQAL